MGNRVIIGPPPRSGSPTKKKRHKIKRNTSYKYWTNVKSKVKNRYFFELGVSKIWLRISVPSKPVGDSSFQQNWAAVNRVAPGDTPANELIIRQFAGGPSAMLAMQLNTECVAAFCPYIKNDRNNILITLRMIRSQEEV